MGEEDRGGVRLEGNNEHFLWYIEAIRAWSQEAQSTGTLGSVSDLSYGNMDTMSEYIYWVFNTIMPHS